MKVTVAPEPYLFANPCPPSMRGVRISELSSVDIRFYHPLSPLSSHTFYHLFFVFSALYLTPPRDLSIPSHPSIPLIAFVYLPNIEISWKMLTLARPTSKVDEDIFSKWACLSIMFIIITIINMMIVVTHTLIHTKDHLHDQIG